VSSPSVLVLEAGATATLQACLLFVYCSIVLYPLRPLLLGPILCYTDSY